ncbi:hematopoietic prostaglandin D synthase-like [Acanthaster planci]|uniref:Hematopoietic prostaglandin D synthase-like n=1 Tax=Acanthaster planci TaxID=133434 RepID=A0A8B7Y2Q8_ACAPL|nr:hematopoietic prostaglandin D synthase-like [Acanthaster planci]
MVKYVLHYFKANGRAESIRLAFKLAGVDCEEVNIEFSEWPKIKNRYPTREVPALEVNGQMLCQSKAILRYLAQEFGLYGKTNLEAAFIDQAIDMVEDIWAAANHTFGGADIILKDKAEPFLREIIPSIYASLERLLALEVAGDFFVGNSITAADLFFFTAIDFVDVMSKGANSLEKFPKLDALKRRIAANPKIAAWLDVRPPEATFKEI